jgi:hypothetical protein
MTIDEQVDELLCDYRDGHSEFQIEYFIVGAEGPTLWGMYHQALRELKKRREILQTFDWDLELARHKRRLWSFVGSVLGWLWLPFRIRAVRAAQRYESIRIAREATRREFGEFLGHATRLKTQLGNTDPAVLEARRWQAKALLLATVDLETVGVLTPRTLEFMLNLPLGIRCEVTEELGARYQYKPRALPLADRQTSNNQMEAYDE